MSADDAVFSIQVRRKARTGGGTVMLRLDYRSGATNQFVIGTIARKENDTFTASTIATTSERPRIVVDNMSDAVSAARALAQEWLESLTVYDAEFHRHATPVPYHAVSNIAAGV